MAASASEIAWQGHAISARFSEGFERTVEAVAARTSFARSRKVPAGAYTSILGMLLARALDDPGDVLRPRDEHEMPCG